jgi:hypothetical protein
MRSGEVVDPALEAYLATVAARLVGPRGVRATTLDELRDGLRCAAAAHRARGLHPPAAAGAALAEFGDPTCLAREFAGELAAVQARRTSLAFLLTGPLVGISWLPLLAPPRLWQQGSDALVASIPALPLVAVGSALGVGVLAATGCRGGGLGRLPCWLLDATTPARLDLHRLGRGDARGAGRRRSPRASEFCRARRDSCHRERCPAPAQHPRCPTVRTRAPRLHRL